jgi:hypothetical protein
VEKLGETERERPVGLGRVEGEGLGEGMVRVALEEVTRINKSVSLQLGVREEKKRKPSWP